MDVNDRRMQVRRTKTAKIATNFSFIGAISAVVGFVSALSSAFGGTAGACASNHPLQFPPAPLCGTSGDFKETIFAM